jgi:hypothetical protein
VLWIDPKEHLGGTLIRRIYENDWKFDGLPKRSVKRMIPIPQTSMGSASYGVK